MNIKKGRVGDHAMLMVDTNVLLDVLHDDPRWAEWSSRHMRMLAQAHALVVNPIVYAELGNSFASPAALNLQLERMQIGFAEVPRAALFLAGQAFVHYRRRGGNKTNVLPDFFIGAHAAVNAWPLLTRDATRIRGYFPSVRVIAPDA